MIRLLLTVLLLLLSTISKAEMVTSPFVFQTTDSKIIKYCSGTCTSEDEFHTTVSAACSAASKLRKPKNTENINFSVSYKKHDDSFCFYTLTTNYFKLSKSYTSEAKYSYNKKEFSKECKSGQRFSVGFGKRPSTDMLMLNGASMCHNNCVVNFLNDTTFTVNTPTDNYKKGDTIAGADVSSTDKSCKLKPFKKTSSDNPCPYNLQYIEGKGCKAPPDKTKCPKDEIYNAKLKKCVVKTVKRNKPPTKNNPKPDNNQSDDTKKCPSGHFYHKQTHQCLQKSDDTGNCPADHYYHPNLKKCYLKDDNGNPAPDHSKNDAHKCPPGFYFDKHKCHKNSSGGGNGSGSDCSQAQKDANGGKCPNSGNGNGSGDGSGKGDKGCTQAQKDANGGKCPDSGNGNGSGDGSGKGDKGCTQAQKDKNNGKCSSRDGDKKNDGEITCQTFKPFCELKKSFNSLVNFFDPSKMDKGDDDKVGVKDGKSSDLGIDTSIKKKFDFGSNQCPAGKSFTISLLNQTKTFQFDMKWLCKFCTELAPYLIISSYLGAALIVAGGRN